MSKKHKIKIVLYLAILFVVCISGSMNARAEGWVKNGSDWKYSEGDVYLKNMWRYLDGNWYYFGSDGNMVRGAKKINGHTYYFSKSRHGIWKDGAMMTNCWQFVDGKYMYFNSSGHYVNDHSQEIGSIKGVDVSEFQGNIDWSAVRNQGISFAFVRIGHGNHNMDPYFGTNMINANAAGVKTGVYFYSTAKSAYDSRLDAQWVIDQMKGYNVNYPVAIDMEDSSQLFLGKQTLTYITKVFCDEIKAAGYTPMVYCNENWASNYLDFSELDGVYKWVARYSGNYDTSISRSIWQTNSRTLLDGISSNSVDLNFCYKDFTTIVTARTGPKAGYTKNTTPVPSRTAYTAAQTGWQKTGTKWWYMNADGSYPKKKWKKIDGKWYYFDASGYMKTGMLKYKGNKYYLNKSGEMAVSSWVKYRGNLYFFNKKGKMLTGWQKIRGKYYFFNKNGTVKTGWYKENGKRFFFSDTGVMYRNKWLKLTNGKYYYFSNEGIMCKNKWVKINNKYYYFFSNGIMARNREVKGYYVDENGVRQPKGKVTPEENTSEQDSTEDKTPEQNNTEDKNTENTNSEQKSSK